MSSKLAAGAVQEADFAQARGVEQEGAAGQLDQLAGDRGVAAEAVLLADRGRRLALLPEQGVDQGRLAGAGGAEQRRRRFRDEQRAQRREAVAAADADRERLVEAEAAAQLGRGRVGVGGEVGLGEHQRDRDLAGGGERGEALGPALVRLRQRLDDQDQVDVGGQRLGGEVLAGGAALEQAAALEHGRDRAGGVDRDPVAGHRRGAPQAATGREQARRPSLPIGDRDQPAAAVLGEDAAGAEAGIGERLQLGGEARAQAGAR